MRVGNTLSSRQQRLCPRPGARAPQPRCPRSVAASAAAAAAPPLKATDKNEGDREWNSTFYPKGIHTDKTDREWCVDALWARLLRYIIDAEGQRLGRMATLVAKYIRGKNSPLYTPSMDTGAMIIIVNAEKVTVTGRKFDQKLYKRHVNGLPGSMKVETFKQLQARLPERIVEKAVWGMLPKGRLGRKIKHNMFVYKGDQHPHQAQKPMDITDRINGRW